MLDFDAWFWCLILTLDFDAWFWHLRLLMNSYDEQTDKRTTLTLESLRDWKSPAKQGRIWCDWWINFSLNYWFTRYFLLYFADWIWEISYLSAYQGRRFEIFHHSFKVSLIPLDFPRFMFRQLHDDIILLHIHCKIYFSWWVACDVITLMTRDDVSLHVSRITMTNDVTIITSPPPGLSYCLSQVSLHSIWHLSHTKRKSFFITNEAYHYFPLLTH